MLTSRAQPVPARRTRRRAGMLPRGRYGEHPLLPYLMVLPHFFFFVIFVCYAYPLNTAGEDLPERVRYAAQAWAAVADRCAISDARLGRAQVPVMRSRR